MSTLSEKRKSDYFKKMFEAHDIIIDIRHRIDNLYSSATNISPSSGGIPSVQPNPHKMEEKIIEMAYLRELGEKLLKARAKFDLFVCTLNHFDVSLLTLRFEKGLSWKEIASVLDVSVSTVNRRYYEICEVAENDRLFDDIGLN